MMFGRLLCRLGRHKADGPPRYRTFALDVFECPRCHAMWHVRRG